MKRSEEHGRLTSSPWSTVPWLLPVAPALFSTAAALPCSRGQVTPDCSSTPPKVSRFQPQCARSRSASPRSCTDAAMTASELYFGKDWGLRGDLLNG